MRWLADENFNNKILKALLRRKPNLDLVRVQDVGLAGAGDGAVLAFAADQGCLVVTHDVRTMSAQAYQRIVNGESMPGVIEIGPYVPIAVAVDEILLLEGCSEPGEWDGQVRHLPL